MKKTYINPELEVVKLQTMQMLAASLEVHDDVEITSEGDILAPGFDFEDDDFDLGAEESISDFE